MSILRIQILVGILATLFISPASASLCSQDIHETMLVVASRLAAMALEARTSPETRYATMHRQPTPYTIAQAEAQLGALPREAVKTYDESMERAVDADSANNLPVCRQALMDAQHALVQTR
jgi:hypothetical protein